MECDENGVCKVPESKDEQTMGKVEASPRDSVTTKAKIRVDIISDNVCPWCWVGKRKLETAMAAFPSTKFDVDWHPFFLGDPHSNPQPTPILEHLQRKYGPRALMMNDALKKNAASLGIKFSDERFELNTLQSHRLVEFSKRFGFKKQNEVIEAIFEAYFANAKDISNIEVLLDIAQQVGLNRDEVKKFLLGGELYSLIFLYFLPLRGLFNSSF